jgi:hypothetical protein
VIGPGAVLVSVLCLLIAAWIAALVLLPGGL